MSGRFQFSLRRLIVSTTLIAAGMACWPLALSVEVRESFAPLALCLFGIIGLPIAGIILLFSRGWVSPLAALLTAGAVVWLLFLSASY